MSAVSVINILLDGGKVRYWSFTKGKPSVLFLYENSYSLILPQNITRINDSEWEKQRSLVHSILVGR